MITRPIAKPTIPRFSEDGEPSGVTPVSRGLRHQTCESVFLGVDLDVCYGDLRLGNSETREYKTLSEA
ncbi:hypothetical protein RRG08_043643 [Elysia crispata]|uniref:Uncharacterized protein n=1 Tax=Elysia crispata TaxID=231223 RepID=A0AAE0ZUL2_9GAST|nr:hypothetical protein RRG08_043643 [Elysia crispata]